MKECKRTSFKEKWQKQTNKKNNNNKTEKKKKNLKTKENKKKESGSPDTASRNIWPLRHKAMSHITFLSHKNTNLLYGVSGHYHHGFRFHIFLKVNVHCFVDRRSRDNSDDKEIK